MLSPVTGPLGLSGDPFPYEASTPLYPNFGFAALPHVNTHDAVAVVEALYRVTSSDDPTNVTGPARLASFTLPDDYSASAEASAWRNRVAPIKAFKGICALLLLIP